MHEVVGISFQEGGRLYYFSPNELSLKFNTKVIVETERGIQLGNVVAEKRTIEDNKIIKTLRKVIRVADENDIRKHESNKNDAAKALIKAKEMVEKKKLNMRVIDATFTLDKAQLLFHFISDNRIDFRDLVKDLASVYHTRIELRQIGVRDKAKEIGGIGSCGRELCCSKFLKDFDSVSINMAKNQNIALNPNKINGLCGRLLCCLMYEDDQYKECKKGMPNMGDRVKKGDISGKVISLDIYRKSYKIFTDDKNIVEISDGCGC